MPAPFSYIITCVLSSGKLRIVNIRVKTMHAQKLLMLTPVSYTHLDVYKRQVSQCAAPLGQLVCGFIFQTFPARIYLPALFTCIAMAVISLAARKLWSETAVS